MFLIYFKSETNKRINLLTNKTYYLLLIFIFFMDYTLLLLCIAAFVASFIDAIVGGGGLIQTPAALVLLPNLPISTVIGTIKIPAFTGTSFAVFQYLKKVTIKWKLLIGMMFLAATSSYLGSTLLTNVSNDFMKPLLLVILILLLIYTYLNKNFGQHKEKVISKQKQIVYSVAMSCILGFYDGFIGPGTGSFLVVAFITLLGYDFLNASANAKMVNLATNFGSILLFAIKGKIIWYFALPMAVSQAVGGFLGAKLAINKGNPFIRVFFLIVVIGTLIKFAYDVLHQK